MNSTFTGTNQREFDAVTKILQSYAMHAASQASYSNCDKGDRYELVNIVEKKLRFRFIDEVILNEKTCNVTCTEQKKGAEIRCSQNYLSYYQPVFAEHVTKNRFGFFT